MSLAEFATAGDRREATATLVTADAESPVYALLTELFGDDAVRVETATTDLDDGSSNAVVVERDGDPVAASSVEALQEELLLVNSDIYVTGTRRLDDVETPDAITALAELPFTVTGYPEHPREKFLLIEMSRHIEATAWQTGDGRLAAGFQYLSRIEAEKGTREVYRRLGADTAVDVHAYGVPDRRPSLTGVTLHGVADEQLRQSWFVAYQSADGAETAALVAVETDSHTWEGRWTYDADRVGDVFAYLDATYD